MIRQLKPTHRNSDAKAKEPEIFKRKKSFIVFNLATCINFHVR